MSILGLVLGIISLIGGIVGTTLLYSTVVGIICIILGILGIIFSVLGRKKGNRGAGTAGLVISILGIIFSIVFTAACAVTHKVVDPIAQEISTMPEEEVSGYLENLANNLESQLETLGN